MKISPLLAAVILFLPAPVRAADPAPMAPLVRAQTVSFKSRVFYVSSEPNGTMRPGQTFLVQAKRPASLRVEDVSRDTDYRPGQEIILLPFDKLVSDGKSQIDINAARRVYVRRKAAPTLTRLVSEGDLTTYLAPDVLFAAAPLSGFTETAPAAVNNVPVRVFVRRRTVRGVTFERRLSIARDTGLPARVANFVADRPGHFTEGDRTDFSGWEINPPLPAATFNAAPPAGMKPAKAARQNGK